MLNIIEWLGGKRVLRSEVRSAMDLNRVIQKGLPLSSVKELAVRAGLTSKEVERIVSRRTLGRLEEARRPLTPDLSDRLARYARVLAMAEEVFESPENAVVWMRRPNRALEGAIPFEMLDTDNGARLVEQVLGRIAHGVFS